MLAGSGSDFWFRLAGFWVGGKDGGGMENEELRIEKVGK